MNRILTSLLAFLLLSALSAMAQVGVPKSKVIRQIDGVEYYIHTIEKGQTLYSISKTYNVEMDDVIRLNPAIREGLKPGQTLLIPTGNPVKQEKPKKQKQPVVPLDTARPAPAPPADLPCGQDPSKKRDVYDVAFMMHFHLDEMDSIRLDDPTIQASAYLSLQFIQFYEGFLMAVDSLKKEGLSLRLHVYDVATDTSETKTFLSDPELKKMDLIVALLYHHNFSMVAEFGKTNSIPVVSPVSERPSQVESNPMVFKVRPSVKTLYSQVADVIARDFGGEHVLIVRNNVSRNKDAVEQLKRELMTRNITTETVDGTQMLDNLDKERPNLVAIITENKTYALDLLTQLNGVKDQFGITVFGLPQWDRLEGMEYDFLSRLRVRVAATTFIDYNDVAVKKFIRDYQAKYKTDPDLLAFTGFDVAHYFLTALYRYGKAFPKCLPKLRIDLLQSKYDFRREGNDGYENSHWMIFYYENYNIYPED